MDALHTFLDAWAAAGKGVDAKIDFIVDKRMRPQVAAYLAGLSLPSGVKDVIAFQKAFYLADHAPADLGLDTDTELAMRAAALRMATTLRATQVNASLADRPSAPTQREAVLRYTAAAAEAAPHGHASVCDVVRRFLAALRAEMVAQLEADPGARDACIACIRESLEQWRPRILACGMSEAEAERLAVVM